MKYKVKVIETDTRYVVLNIEADSEEEAREAAEDTACNCEGPELDWETGDFDRETEVET